MRGLLMRAVIAATLLVPRNAMAEDPEPIAPPGDLLHLVSGNSILRVPGHDSKPPVVVLLPKDTRILMPHAWDKLDEEMRRLQDTQTRLTAENKHMRERVKGWQPGWKTLGVTALTAITTGIYLGRKL